MGKFIGKIIGRMVILRAFAGFLLARYCRLQGGIGILQIFCKKRRRVRGDCPVTVGGGVKHLDTLLYPFNSAFIGFFTRVIIRFGFIPFIRKISLGMHSNRLFPFALRADHRRVQFVQQILPRLLAGRKPGGFRLAGAGNNKH